MLETDRRVLGNLSEPASMPVLVGALMSDKHSPFDIAEGYPSVQEDVEKILTKLVRRGLVVSLGSHADATSLLRAVALDDKAIDLPDAKAEALKSRLQSGRDIRLHVGALFVMSKAGFDALHEPLPEPA